MRDVASPVSPGPPVDYGPLTLAEKHADLLQFIAQKESKLLELRSQLAVQEAELAELKRKWERIVSRGMDRAYSSPLTPGRSPYANGVSPSFPVSSIIPTASTAIKEGVRLLAAGLDLSASEPSSPPAFSPPALPMSGIATVSRASLASTAAMKKAAASKHAANQSISSASTTTTSSSSAPSKRLSQSSASSLLSSLSLEDPVEDCDSARPSPISEEKPEVPAEAVGLRSSRSSNSTLRRRSKDAEPRPSSSAVMPMSEPSTTTRRHSRTHDTSLSSNAAVPQSDNSGWMGSVGKKWEEMQQGETALKLQKRSSLLFEMSQSLFSALASPAPTSPAPSKPSPLSPSLSSAPESLMDDEPELEHGLGAVMVPQVVSPTPVPPLSQPAKSADDDDEEWNW
ncbi:uncharacterized protein PHACADRAFT_253724 [Phanerochaete carnosa HHB-10118-sp]|uniref:Uncharacterized protein n=1 Tax=Phanerochaete carnosa (strain HHB-10118-sp) TaxID=650164 RepID=K5WBF0_PHACS|nr:uncharacterized protein PHACADRAFT_253724 [Phanerochaete carnosa HHB-10118-sp]EKM56535.1 hypothetical protein PHACADRAFT_253724 [Phanerochaete carnosa HHB-10118-sp]